METVDIERTIDTKFGAVGVPDLAYFRRSEWLDDSCLKLVLSHLMDQDRDDQGQSRIGGVNPLCATLHDEAMKLQTIETSPFDSINRLVLIPVFLDGHWAGAVLDYKNGKKVIFDPMQTTYYYKIVCIVLDKYFGKFAADLKPIRQRAPRQEDTNSYGPLTLLFF
ncbi:hypothetical protein L917_10104 [Phytophthora nicotianae]|uniref:Ubiquitin-like protease family profile domain-containing protein n=1 Tax=Phytophthora nicotianae TaxID=4792 RepID=W2L3X1_PHYNI|nr:hypothetical protein L917_10104 [Phytophthora nicotianae]